MDVRSLLGLQIIWFVLGMMSVVGCQQSKQKPIQTQQSRLGQTVVTVSPRVSSTVPRDAVVAEVRGISPSWTDFFNLRNDPISEPRSIGTTVHAPPGFDPSRPFHLVFFFRGVWACSAAFLAEHPVACREGERPIQGGWLGWRHDQAHANSLFIAPQFGFGAQHPGRFARPGGFRAYVEELLQETLRTRLGGSHTINDVSGITLIGASAGGTPTSLVLDNGDLADKIHNVILFDAAYHSVESYVRWIRRSTTTQPHRFFCAYTSGTTFLNCVAIGQAASAIPGVDVHFTRDRSLTPESLRHQVVVFASREANHGDMVWTYFIRIIQSLQLPTLPS